MHEAVVFEPGLAKFAAHEKTTLYLRTCKKALRPRSGVCVVANHGKKVHR